MLKYENTSCPVCNRQFEEGDDIVTCPDCGTPHHRECYNMIGKCVNHGLHSSGYVYGENSKVDNTASTGEYYTPQQDEAAATPKMPAPIPMEFNPESIEKEYGNSNETIDGVNVSDIVYFVRSNYTTFLEKFKSNKKRGWNWSAFLFGGLYFLYRKMYAQGAALVGFVTALILGSEALIYKFAPQYSQAVQDMAMEYAQTRSFDPDALMGIADMGTASKIVYALIGVIILVRIIVAMLFDGLYKKHVCSSIKKINEELDENGMLIQGPFMINGADSMSQERMRKMYLSRRGGTSMFTPMTAVFIVYMILSFI